MEDAMRIFRQITGDVMSGGLIAVLVALTIMLQGPIGGYGQSAMASIYVDDGIICSSHGAPAERQPGDHHETDCCLTSCQIAAFLATALPAFGPSVPAYLVSDADISGSATSGGLPLRLLGLSGRPRAPPLFSV